MIFYNKYNLTMAFDELALVFFHDWYAVLKVVELVFEALVGVGKLPVPPPHKIISEFQPIFPNIFSGLPKNYYENYYANDRSS